MTVAKTSSYTSATVRILGTDSPRGGTPSRADFRFFWKLP